MPEPPADGRVTVTLASGVATLSFFHPKGNSLPGPLLARLAAEVSALTTEPAARVILLRSEGTGAFCGGASFQELQALRDAGQGAAFFMGFARLILAMIRCPKLIVARVQGRTVGGGVGITAASDYAIAAPAASIKLSELAVGIGPFVVGPVIEKKIGLAAFSSLAIQATQWRDAAWAREKGLFSEVRDSVDEVDRAAAELTARLAGSNPEAMARMKAVFWEGTDQWDELLARRAAVSGGLVLSPFAQQAIASR